MRIPSALYNRCCASPLTLSRTIGDFAAGRPLRTASMLEQPLKFFVVFFVVVEPVSLIPLFTGLTSGAAAAYKRRMAVEAVSGSAEILLIAPHSGHAVLRLECIFLLSLCIFGGLLTFRP